MEYTTTFDSQLSVDEFKQMTLKYFTTQGFKVKTNAEDTIILEKGSLIRNMYTFNPLKWKSYVEITYKHGKIKAQYNINTTYQMVSTSEVQVWIIFMENYENALLHNINYTVENNKMITTHKKRIPKYILHAFLGALIFGIPGGIISYYTGNDSLPGVAAGIGAITFLKQKMNKETIS